MKHLLIITTFIFCCVSAIATNPSDSLHNNFHQKHSTDVELEYLRHANKTLQAEIASLNLNIEAKDSEIDSLENILRDTNLRITTLSDSIKINASIMLAQIQDNSESLNHAIDRKSQIGLWIYILLIFFIAVSAFIFGRILAKRGKEIDSLSAKTDKLKEEVVLYMSKEITEIQSISNKLNSIEDLSSARSETERKLVFALANRITFMEMTLSKMDRSIRGYKQLSKSIQQMKDNLLVSGYELVDMLGKDYHNGMKVTANFVEDEELPFGKQIISTIIKPQINYKGKMIQSAQITVSQNI
ncbi:MAG: hypothetical protein K2L83_00490 [Muribaculaceae bacterium]|nr:hypothetical protein [Muribaculaceae bacterium]